MKDLYEVAKNITREAGFDWTDPRTGVTFPANTKPVSKQLTGAQVALLESLQSGATLAAVRMSGRNKAQSRIVRSDTGEDVTSVANALRWRGLLRDDYTLAKAGRKVERPK